jgi:actin-related protein
MLFIKMGFKAIFVHNESVMATYAMAAQTACVVDIGSQKISVCCVDDGVVLPKTFTKRNFGGDDISELLLRLINSKDSLHYFPKEVFHPLSYPYHMMLLEHIKEQNTSMQMSD